LLCTFPIGSMGWQWLRYEAKLLGAWIPGKHGCGPPAGRGLGASQELGSHQEAREDERTLHSSFPCPREPERASIDLAR
jgi:hypothetical protein